MLGILLASLGAKVFGAIGSAQANNRIRRRLQRRSQSLDDVFNKEYDMDYMQTSGVKNTLAAYGKNIKDINKNIEGRAAMAGSTPETVIAGREQTGQNYVDFIRKVAAGQDQYRADKERLYAMRRDSLDQQIMANDEQRAGQWNNLMSNAAGLGTAAIAAGSTGGSGGFLNGLFQKKVIPGLGGGRD